MKQGFKIAIGVALVGGAVGAGFYFYNQGMVGKKSGYGRGSGAGSGKGAGGGGAVEPDTSGDDPRCAIVFKMTRAQMLSELGLNPKTPSPHGLSNSPVNIGNIMHPIWMTPVSTSILRLRIMVKRGIAKCGHEEENVSFSGGRGIFA